jgi:hypothetical protein
MTLHFWGLLSQLALDIVALHSEISVWAWTTKLMFLNLLHILKKSSPLIWIMGEALRESIFYMKIVFKLLQLCSLSGGYNHTPRFYLCSWFGAAVCTGCIYLIFMVFFNVCKQHSLTWNVLQFKCQPLNTQNGQSIFFRTYSQFLVLCEYREISKKQRESYLGFWKWGGLKEYLQCIPLI